MLIGYSGDAQALLQALLKAGFMDANPLRIHDWEEHNRYHVAFSERARNAALAMHEKRRQALSKEKTPAPPKEGQDSTGQDKTRVSSACGTASSTVEAAGSVLEHLNLKASREFRLTTGNLKLVRCRLEEVNGDVDGVKIMIDRMCAKWKTDPDMFEYLRPETLFGKQKFGGYYDMRTLPVTANGNGQPATQQPLFAQRQAVEKQMAKHPANSHFAGHCAAKVTPEQKAEYQKLKERLKEIEKQEAGV